MTRFHATIGGVIPFTEAEELEADQREAEWLAGKLKRDVLAQIVALEASITVRRQREAIIGADNGWMASVDAQIAELRNSLI